LTGKNEGEGLFYKQQTLKSRNRSDLQKHVFDGTKENFIEMKNN
jgi:hypothetical protein